MSRDNFEWVTDTDDNNLAIIARCGKWQAELAMNEPYTPGLLFITPKEKHRELFPNKLGEGKVDDLSSLFEFIHKISTRMLKNEFRCTVHGNKCSCENVYLLSLNENDGTSPIHFRLWPRYLHDDDYLDIIDAETTQKNDALALMAKRRRDFLIRQSKNCWGNWPPSREKNKDGWKYYALEIKKMICPKT